MSILTRLAATSIRARLAAGAVAVAAAGGTTAVMLAGPGDTTLPAIASTQGHTLRLGLPPAAGSYTPTPIDTIRLSRLGTQGAPSAVVVAEAQLRTGWKSRPPGELFRWVRGDSTNLGLAADGAGATIRALTDEGTRTSVCIEWAAPAQANAGTVAETVRTCVPVVLNGGPSAPEPVDSLPVDTVPTIPPDVDTPPAPVVMQPDVPSTQGRRLTVTPDSVTLHAGEPRTLTATAFSSANRRVPLARITWTASEGSGLVLANAVAGTVEVSAPSALAEAQVCAEWTVGTPSETLRTCARVSAASGAIVPVPPDTATPPANYPDFSDTTRNPFDMGKLLGTGELTRYFVPRDRAVTRVLLLRADSSVLVLDYRTRGDTVVSISGVLRGVPGMGWVRDTIDVGGDLVTPPPQD